MGQKLDKNYQSLYANFKATNQLSTLHALYSDLKYPSKESIADEEDPELFARVETATKNERDYYEERMLLDFVAEITQRF